MIWASLFYVRLAKFFELYIDGTDYDLLFGKYAQWTVHGLF
jgi:hypothetical protein